jgi:thiamine pyrophosphate-dependent acetolactate synthase large subunit-like protein
MNVMNIPLADALRIIAQHRGQRVVVPTMSSVAVWPNFSDGPLDFHYIPSSMGQGPSLGLGLALAKPNHGAIVLCGDGSLLMNLGCLVTIAQHPANLWVILLDNAQYEITGGQPVAGADRTDFGTLARAAGIARTYQFADTAAWDRQAKEVLAGAGPVFVWLKIESRAGVTTPVAPRPMAQQVMQLRSGLGMVD